MPLPGLEKQLVEMRMPAVTGLCLLLAVGVAATARVPPSVKTENAGISARHATNGARYGGRIATVTRKPVAIQHIAPPLKLQPLFDQIGYRLDQVRRYGDVPRLFLIKLPVDLREIREPQQRKVLFIKMALPLILHANEIILSDRKKVLRLIDKLRIGKTISSREQVWLDKKAQEYGLAETDLTELVRRVDMIPPSLALAQAAEESGWGTSRFAHEGNAIFGQRTWNGANNMKPERRPEGETFEVRAFSRLIDGVMSYTRNLNGHVAYDEFRRAREAQRHEGGSLNGYALVENLGRYSERGDAYIETIHTLMRVNKLQAFDRARLSDQYAVDWSGPGA